MIALPRLAPLMWPLRLLSQRPLRWCWIGPKPHALCLYAESVDRRLRQASDHGTNFDGTHYKFFKANRLMRGNFVEIPLIC
jgi:hypothetical protein